MGESEEAESCRTKFWKGESYTEMHRVNEFLLNIKIHMYRVKPQSAGQRMAQEL